MKLSNSEIERIYGSQIKNCKKCTLSITRTNIVMGSGSLNAEILFVGQNPGKTEDIKGEPFTGKSGILFKKLLDELGYERESYFLTNMIKCYPSDSGNSYRNPLHDEIKACKDYLFSEIRYINPKIIVALGSSAAKVLTNSKKKDINVGECRKKVFECYFNTSIPVYITYNPASILYSESSQNSDNKYYNDIIDDLKFFREVIKNVKHTNISSENNLITRILS